MKTLESLWSDLFRPLSSFGYTEGQGTTRLSWSPAFLAAQDFLQQYAEKNGLHCEKDGWGNLLMTVPGKEDLPPVYTGSHLDTVPHGGKYDGALGITVPLAIARSWHEKGFLPRRPLTIIAFAEEEGTRFGTPCMGSQALTGRLQGQSPEAFVTPDGCPLPQLLQQAGLKGDPFAPHLLPGKCFLELHIEQGRSLEDAQLPLGIVSAIVGIRHFMITVQGKANHAGTTAMKDRQDALAAAAAEITEIYQSALASQGQYVATVGHIRVSPDAGNVIPGEAEMSLEIRAAEDSVMDQAIARFKEFSHGLEQQYDVIFSWKQLDQIPPLPMDQKIMELFKDYATKESVPFQIQPSWAGHDSMIVGHFLPTAMLFVPSKNGISHSPEEFTSAEDIGQAAEVLEKVLMHLTME